MSALDLSLAFQARDLVGFLAGRLPTPDELEIVTREKGVEFATKLLQMAIAHATLHGPFMRHVRSATPLKKGGDKKSLEPIEVVIVASRSPDAGSAWGGHCAWMRTLARGQGFTTEVIETLERESVSENARLIGQHLMSSSAGRILLVTVGRGTSEFHMLLKKRGPRAPELEKLRAWINVAGSFFGSRLIEAELAGSVSHLKLWFDAFVGRRKFAAVQELSSGFPLWRRPLQTPPSLMLVSAVGLPTKEHLPPGRLRKNHERLSAFGPNDGMVLAMDAIARPGLIFPVTGMGHDVAEAVFRPVLERIFTVCEQVIREGDRRRSPSPSPGHQLMLSPIQDVSEDQRGDDSRIGFDHESWRLDSELSPGNFLVGDGA